MSHVVFQACMVTLYKEAVYWESLRHLHLTK